MVSFFTFSDLPNQILEATSSFSVIDYLVNEELFDAIGSDNWTWLGMVSVGEEVGIIREERFQDACMKSREGIW